MTQEEFKQMKECYNVNTMFHDFVEQYRCVRGLTVWDALTYPTIYNIWKEKYQ